MTLTIPPEVQAQAVQAGAWLWDAYGKDWVSKLTGWAKQEAQWKFAIERYYTSLYGRVGFVRILGRHEAEPLANVFTHVNVLDRPSADLRYDIARLLAEQAPRDFAARLRQARVPGDDALAKHPKLFVLGKPGAGKTTFLKHTAVRAIKHEIEKVPIFVTLKELAESDQEIVPFIAHQLTVHGVPQAAAFAEKLLVDGRALVLFDGLDEVNLADNQRTTMIRRLNDFVDQYSDCPTVITCRVSAVDYAFTQFEYVEMADFDTAQIGAYIDRWFVGDEVKRLGCRRALLADSDSEAVRELAQVPLLLALLCLVYEERNEIPPERHEIYEEATRALLSKWDASRNIVRDTVYEKLTLKRKQGLLAQLAAQNFEQNVYFMRESPLTREIERYLVGVPGLEEPDGWKVLRNMEAQHGILVERAARIHSFSHLTLQEYYTALYIVENESRGSVRGLMTHVGDDRWREVFLLVAGMLSDATDFSHAYLDALAALASDEANLVDLLNWAAGKGAEQDTAYKADAVRAFLVFRALARDFDRSRDRHLALALDRALALARDLDRDLRLALDLALGLDRYVDLGLTFDSDGHDFDLGRDRNRALALERDLARSYEQGVLLAAAWQDERLRRALQDLGVPPALAELADFEPLAAWVEQFAQLMAPTRERWDPYQQIRVRDEVDSFLHLSEDQLEQLSTYLDATYLLNRCLALAYVPDRQAIEAQMLLPLVD